MWFGGLGHKSPPMEVDQEAGRRGEALGLQPQWQRDGAPLRAGERQQSLAVLGRGGGERSEWTKGEKSHTNNEEHHKMTDGDVCIALIPVHTLCVYCKQSLVLSLLIYFIASNRAPLRAGLTSCSAAACCQPLLHQRTLILIHQQKQGGRGVVAEEGGFPLMWACILRH